MMVFFSLALLHAKQIPVKKEQPFWQKQRQVAPSCFDIKGILPDQFGVF
jgi:hypothetical protein